MRVPGKIKSKRIGIRQDDEGEWITVSLVISQTIVDSRMVAVAEPIERSLCVSAHSGLQITFGSIALIHELCISLGQCQ
jgi:hypothetical protein